MSIYIVTRLILIIVCCVITAIIILCIVCIIYEWKKSKSISKNNIPGLSSNMNFPTKGVYKVKAMRNISFFIDYRSSQMKSNITSENSDIEGRTHG